MNEVETAYLAGFFDGEGNIHTAARTGIVRISVAQNESQRKILELFLEFGGGIYGPYSKHGTGLQWASTKRSTSILTLETLLPYLKVKRQKAYNTLIYLKNEMINARIYRDRQPTEKQLPI